VSAAVWEKTNPYAFEQMRCSAFAIVLRLSKRENFGVLDIFFWVWIITGGMFFDGKNNKGGER